MVLDRVEHEIGHVIARGNVLDARIEHVVGVDLLEALDSLAVQDLKMRYLEQYDETRVLELAQRIGAQAQRAQQLQVHQIIQIGNIVNLREGLIGVYFVLIN